MATYYEVINDQNSTLVDDSFKNYEIIQRGICLPYWNQGGNGMINYPGDPGLNNLVFVRPVGHTQRFRNYGPPPSGLTQQVGVPPFLVWPVGTYFGIWSGGDNLQYEYIVAKIGASAPANGAVIQAFNASGEEVFHSGRKYLKVTEGWMQAATYSPVTRNLKAPSAGKNLFVCINHLGLTSHTSTVIPGESSDTYSAFRTVRLNGNQITVNTYDDLGDGTGDTTIWEMPIGTLYPVLIAEA